MINSAVPDSASHLSALRTHRSARISAAKGLKTCSIGKPRQSSCAVKFLSANATRRKPQIGFASRIRGHDDPF